MVESFRILIFTTLMTTFMISIAFGASLTSVLSYTIFTSHIQNLGDILKNDLRLIIWKGTSYESYFREALPGSEAYEVCVILHKNVPIN